MSRADVVSFLVEQKDIDVTLGLNGYTLLGVACSNSHEKVAAALLKHLDLNAGTHAHTNPSQPWSNHCDLPIHLATKHKHLGVIRLLVEDDNIKADVNAKNGDGKTPLHIACESNYEEIVSYLLGREGIRVNDQTESGETPLLIAANRANVPILRMLLQRKDIMSTSVRPTARHLYT